MNITKRFSSLLFVFLLALGAASAQETTGNIEITVKDPTGAVVPNASVTVETSRSARSSTTDEAGFQRILQIPPGRFCTTIR